MMEIDRGKEPQNVSCETVCSICLDAVRTNGERSMAKLCCGHEFHLDCIGSAFNAKGKMQCPNCRKIEEGEWLYRNDDRSTSELSTTDEWVDFDEIFDDINYPEMVPLGFHWCPFIRLTQPSSLLEEEGTAIIDHELLSDHTTFTEHMTNPLPAHQDPHVTYFQTLQVSPSLNSIDTFTHSSTFPQYWHQNPRYIDASTSHSLFTFDLPHHSWDHHSTYVDNHHGGNGTLRTDSDNVPQATTMHSFPYGSGSISTDFQIPSNITHHDAPSSSRTSHHHTFSSPTFNQSAFYSHPDLLSSTDDIRDSEVSHRNRFYAWERDRLAPFPLVPVDRVAGWWSPFQNILQ